MALKENYAERMEKLAEPVLEEIGLSLYDTEYVKEGSEWYLRVYIDKQGGVDINDCVKATDALNPILDKENFIEDAYIFEVSSPGLGRTLTKDKHYEKSLGEKVVVKLYKAVDKQKEFEGILKDFSETAIVIAVDEKEMSFERKDIAKCSLAVEF